MITTQSDGRPISAGFAQAMAAGLVEYDLKLWTGGAAVPCVVKSAKLSLGAGLVGDMATEDFAIGQLLTTQLDAQLYDCPDLMGEELQVRVGVKVDGSYEYVTVATVTVSTSKEWKGVTTVQAVGAAGAALAAPAGLSDGYMGASALAAAIGAAAGLTVSLGAFSSTAVQVHVDAAMNCREALRALAVNLGGFAAETPDGNVLVSPFDGAATYTMPEEFAVKAPEIQPEDYEADGLEVSNGEEAYTYGTGRVKAVIQGATAESSAVTWGNLEGYQYRPGRLETALVDPRVTCFDVVSLTMGQDTWLVPSRGIDAKFDGGYFGSYSAAGLTAIQEEALREGPLSQRVATAETIAMEAQQVAEAVNQHFWHDANGAHVTDSTRDDWRTEYAKPNHGELSNPTDAHPWYNQLMNSAGNLLRTGLVNLASWTRSAIAFYDGLGNAASNIVARFGVGTFQIGADEDAHLSGDYRSISIVDKEGGTFFEVSDLRDSTGYADMKSEFVGNGIARRFYTWVPCEPGTLSVTVDGNAASATEGFVSFELATAPATGAVIVAEYKTNFGGAKAYTLGFRKDGSAVGAMSVAEGHDVTSSAICSHAEGESAKASGAYSHAEGSGTEASGAYSHAEGISTVASGSCSHAQNEGTIASNPYQTAMGIYNDPGNGEYALTVGNGSSSSRSNAMTVDWVGNVEAAGEVKGATAVLNCTLDTTKVASGSVMKVVRSGNIAQLRFGPIETSVDFADRTTVNVGTLPSGCTPALNANAPVFVTTNIGYMGYVGVTTGGVVSVRCQTGATVPAGTKFYATVPLVLT